MHAFQYLPNKQKNVSVNDLKHDYTYYLDYQYHLAHKNTI